MVHGRYGHTRLRHNKKGVRHENDYKTPGLGLPLLGHCFSLRLCQSSDAQHCSAKSSKAFETDDTKPSKQTTYDTCRVKNNIVYIKHHSTSMPFDSCLVCRSCLRPVSSLAAPASGRRELGGAPWWRRCRGTERRAEERNRKGAIEQNRKRESI